MGLAVSAPGAKGAVGSALAEAIDAARAADAEQLDLIGMPDAIVGADRAASLRVSAAAGRRGRPPGAANLATRELKDFIRKVFNYDPLLEGVRWLQHSPESLAAALGCTRLEAFDRLEGIRRSLAPFFHAAQAPVDEKGNAVPFFQMTIGGAPSSAPGAQAPWIYPGGPVIDNEQNQQVSDAPALQSHGAQSHEDDK